MRAGGGIVIFAESSAMKSGKKVAARQRNLPSRRQVIDRLERRVLLANIAIVVYLVIEVRRTRNLKTPG